MKNTTTGKQQPTADVIPKSQAYAIIGLSLLLGLCACGLLAAWQLGSLPVIPQNLSISLPNSAPPADNATLQQRLKDCRPECAGVNLATLNVKGKSIFLDSLNLQGANLSGANLSTNTLIHSDLNGANLRDADLRMTDMRWGNFTSADFKGADLRLAILSAANLTDAKLGGTNLEGAMYDKHTTWPAGFDASAAGAILVGQQ